MKKLKAVHIHTDLKFVDETHSFEGDYFVNQVIFIGEKKYYNGPCSEKLQFIKRNYFGLKKIIKICNQSDIVILYDLDSIKSAIANSISSTVKIAWRFFGYELYKRKKKQFISSESYKTLIDVDKFVFLKNLKSSNLLSHLNPINFFFDTSFDRAVLRTDFFLCLSEMEYEELLKYWPNLPGFIQIPFWDQSIVFKPEELWEMKEPVIILGNNKSIYNNHLDVIREVEKSNKAPVYDYIIPFSYGVDSNYTNSVRHKVKEMSRFTLLEDFLPYKKYNEIIRQSSALIVNSYRQIGMVTIFMAIKGGTKIYLNPKNITYTWLKTKGFKIYDINSLGPNLKTQNIRLSVSEIEFNLQALRDFQDSYPKTEFQRILVEKVLIKD